MIVSIIWLISLLLSFSIEATQSDDALLNFYQLRAHSQPRQSNGGRFAPGRSYPVLSTEQYEEASIEEMKGIRARALVREKRGERKYPICYDEPKDQSEWLQRRDYMALNRFPSYAKKWKLPLNGQALQLFNEIKSWKPAANDVLDSRVENYISRLNQIKARAIAREARGLNKYPKRDNSGNQESKDAMYIYARPRYSEALPLWEEINSWKLLSPASESSRGKKRKNAVQTPPSDAIEYEGADQSGRNLSSTKRQTLSNNSPNSLLTEPSSPEPMLQTDVDSMFFDPRFQSALFDDNMFVTQLAGFLGDEEEHVATQNIFPLIPAIFMPASVLTIFAALACFNCSKANDEYKGTLYIEF